MTSLSSNLPFQFRPLQSSRPYLRDFEGYGDFLPHVSTPGGWIVRHDYGELYAKDILNMKLRDDDIWIITFPKSGTTWTQSIIWLLLHDGQFPQNNSHLDDVSPHLELDQGEPKDKIRMKLESKLRDCEDDALRDMIEDRLQKLDKSPVDLANELPKDEPRLLKSHLPFCFLPPEVVNKNKVVFVYRDPRDVVVSYFHHMRLMSDSSFSGSFQDFFEYFIGDEINAGPFWEFIIQVYEHRGKDNFHFITFEDMKKDLPSVIRGLIQFLDLTHREYDIDKLCEMVSLQNMKNNSAVDNSEAMIKMGLFNDNRGTFIRQGKVGGWKDFISEDMLERMNAWTMNKTKGSNLPMDELYPEQSAHK